MDTKELERLVERLEEYRVAEELTELEMALLLGANWGQQYSAWVNKRRTLPKKYISPALAILSTPSGEDELTTKLIQRIRAYSHEQREDLWRIAGRIEPDQPQRD